MKSKPFVHLHLHTNYSLLDGACRIDQVMDRAVENNMPAVAITDHGVMYGMIEFYKAAQERGIKPILGCEVYITGGSRFDRKADGKSSANHLVLLATSTAGYYNLVKLVSTAHLEGFYYKPRIDREILSQWNEGLIGLSACLKGQVASCLLDDDVPGAVRMAGEYADIFGKDRFFLEIQDHGIEDQRKVNRIIGQVSSQTGLPLVATNDVHYLDKDHAEAHEVLLCLQTQTVLSDPKHMRYQTPQFYMKTRQEMEHLFREFPGSVDQTLAIAEMCNVELEFGKPHFPSFTPPAGMTQREHLVQLGLDGVKALYGIKDPDHPRDAREKEVMDRFHQEVGVIEKTGYINYYLVVWDFIRFAKQSGIPVGPGRGSGGGSLLAYVMGITTIDPLRYGLIFERFLNPERVSPPDFDIDFCQARREEVIQYVKTKYGSENVAQIITFGSLGAKTVIRDVGRVLEIPFPKCDKFSKMVPEDPKMTLELALAQNPEFRKEYETDPDCARILKYGFVLEGLSRNAGTHAAGVVIGEKPLIEIIPLARDKDKQPITQYSMEPLGEIGLLKMDFLGLKTLTVIQEALVLIQQHRSLEVDLEKIPFDDKPTYELLSRGDTVGVFQLESSGMRNLIRRITIDRIEDLIAMIALYRPGPMNMLDDYVDRKTGKAEKKYDHPLLEPILSETYGVMVYQEQVQKAANVLAGYSLGQADILRRAMGKKKAEIMEGERAKFVEGCRKTNKMAPQLAQRIFDNIAKFAGYGFNKAHSAGYAILAYQTAFLKANYPAEFMSALLSSEIGNFDKLPGFIAEAEIMKLQVLPPDINTSGSRFRPEGQGLRFGLAGVKNVGEGAAETISREREKNGPYKDLVDFCSRMDGQLVNRKVMESLVRCGAMDSLGMHRARLFSAVEFAMARAADAMRDRKSGQGSLFDLMEDSAASPQAIDLPDCEEWPESVQLAGEKELLGTYMSGHPLTQYAGLLKRYQLATVEELPNLKDGTLTRLGGIAAQISRKITKTTKAPWLILKLEDLDGSVEVMVFPETLQKYGGHVVQDGAVLVCGEVSRRNDQIQIIAAEIYPLPEAPRLFAVRVGIHIPAVQAANGALERVRDILLRHPGNTPVTICLIYPSGEKVFLDTENAFHVLAEEILLQELEMELGEKSTYVATDPNPCKKGRPDRRPWARDRSETA